MTVPTETSLDSFIGDGVSFDLFTSFGARAASEFTVRKKVGTAAATLLVLGVDYTVSFSEVSADIQLTAPQTAGALYTVERIVPLTQLVDLRTQGNFSPAVHELIVDEACYRDQQLANRIKVLESAGAPGSVIAGDGVYFASTTLHVGAGPGIVVQPDAVTLDYAAAAPGVINATGGATGALNKVARADHNHSVAVAAPGAILAGASAAQGVSTSLARADHQHSVATAAPVNVTKAAASAGVATTFAASDHKHDVTTAAAIDLTDAVNAEGVATTLARSDHTHQHGARGGGSLHAIATGAVAGFLSAADKTRLDAMLVPAWAFGAGASTPTIAAGSNANIDLALAAFRGASIVATGTPIVFQGFTAGWWQFSLLAAANTTTAGNYALAAYLKINGAIYEVAAFQATLPATSSNTLALTSIAFISSTVISVGVNLAVGAGAPASVPFGLSRLVCTYLGA